MKSSTGTVSHQPFSNSRPICSVSHLLVWGFACAKICTAIALGITHLLPDQDTPISLGVASQQQLLSGTRTEGFAEIYAAITMATYALLPRRSVVRIFTRITLDTASLHLRGSGAELRWNKYHAGPVIDDCGSSLLPWKRIKPRKWNRGLLQNLPSVDQTSQIVDVDYCHSPWWNIKTENGWLW